MKLSEANDILDRIQTQFRALGQFYDDACGRVYGELIAPHDAVLVGQIVDSYFQRNPRSVMTPTELEQAIRDANNRAVRRSEADHFRDLVRTPPDVAKSLLREGFERDWRERHGDKPIPAETERLFSTVSNSIGAGEPRRRQADEGGK